MAGSKQLISQFNPDSYSLELNLDKQSKKFSGKLSIKGVRRSKPSYRITLNQSGLEISSAKVFRLDKGIKSELRLVRIVHHAKLQEIRLHTENQVFSGSYELELEYSGKISTKGTSGVYTSTWLNNDHEAQEIITTQFQPHYARRLLPCIDEPQAKAIFGIGLDLNGTPDNKKDAVLFNTSIESDIASEHSRKIKFETTPVMSTYLLALVIGELDVRSVESRNGTKISIYSTPNKIESTSFALDIAAKMLDFLEDKFQTKYPLGKLDLVAVPDFESSAGMENWGLIIFREDYLLYDELVSTLVDKQAIAQVVAHEISHQWFGNLVTMKWWDELWLNEGFASFMEYYTVDKIFPEWKVFEGYTAMEKSYAIMLDSLPGSRPIVNKVTSPHHSVEVFDGIAYEKSGSIIRMIFTIIGEEGFMSGLKDYFTKFSYKSASSLDLLKCWQQYTKLNLSKFTKTWLYEPGLPLLEVSVGDNPTQIRLEQSRFLSQSAQKVNINRVQLNALRLKPNIHKQQRLFYENQIANKIGKARQPIWDIPINFVGEGKQDQKIQDFVMTKQRHTIQLPKNSPLPLKVNKDGAAFYIASYSLEFLAGISKSIENNDLGDLDTLNLLSDIISLNRAGKFKSGAGSILDIMSSGKHIANPQFWGLVGGFIGYLHYHLKHISKTRLLDTYVCTLIDLRLQEVGFESSLKDPSGTTMIRFELLSLAALAQEPGCMDRLIKLYENAQESGIDFIESEKRLLVLYSVAKRGKKSDYKYFLQSYKENLGDPGLRDDLTYALCLFEDDTSVRDNIGIMQDPDLVRTQDILSWLVQIISAGQKATEITLAWITKQGGWEWLSKNLSSQDLSSAVKIITSTAFTTKDLNKLKSFFENLHNIELEKALDEATDMAKSRISWHKKELPRAIDYLS